MRSVKQGFLRHAQRPRAGRRHSIMGTVPPQHMFGFESTVLLALQARGYRVTAQPMAGSDGQQMANITIRAVP